MYNKKHKGGKKMVDSDFNLKGNGQTDAASHLPMPWDTIGGNEPQLEVTIGKLKMPELSQQETQHILTGLEKFNSSLSISAHKLLNTAIAGLIAGYKDEKEIDIWKLRATFPVREYALRCGYDVDEHPTETEEEKIAETERAKTQLRSFACKVRKELDLLMDYSIQWEEKIKGKMKDFCIISAFSSVGLRDGTIRIEFSPLMAECLLKHPPVPYHESLLGIGEHNTDAYVMGLEIAKRDNIRRNQEPDMTGLLKVSALLDAVLITPADNTRKRFESAMDSLVTCGFLAGWNYVYDADAPENLEPSMTGYEKWSDTFVSFTIKKQPRHIAQLCS